MQQKKWAYLFTYYWLILAVAIHWPIKQQVLGLVRISTTRITQNNTADNNDKS